LFRVVFVNIHTIRTLVLFFYLSMHSQNSAEVYFSERIVHTIIPTVWTDEKTVWTVRVTVWTSNLTVWTSNLTVWTVRVTLWTTNLIVWTTILAVWTDEKMVRTIF